MAGIVEALVEASKDAHMVVVGARGRGAVRRVLLGSVSAGLIHHAHCPVAVIHSRDGRLPTADAPVVVGIDGSPASEAATALVFDEASRRAAELVAVHMCSDVAPIPGAATDRDQCSSRPRKASPAGRNGIRTSGPAVSWSVTGPRGGGSVRAVHRREAGLRAPVAPGRRGALEQHGFPHWTVYDEAHLLGPGQEVRWVRRCGYVLSSFVAAALPADEIDTSDVVVVMEDSDQSPSTLHPVPRAAVRYGGNPKRACEVPSAARHTSGIGTSTPMSRCPESGGSTSIPWTVSRLRPRAPWRSSAPRSEGSPPRRWNFISSAGISPGGWSASSMTGNWRRRWPLGRTRWRRIGQRRSNGSANSSSVLFVTVISTTAVRWSEPGMSSPPRPRG